MATLAFSLAGQALGGAVGGPFGAVVGRALGALAGSAVDQAIFGARPERAGTDIRLFGSTEGIAIPRVYGWSRVAGNIVWATDLEKIAPEGAGAKGFGGNDGEVVAASFALALCEGEVAHLGRIWADGKLLETEGLKIRFYRGTATQQPDSFIAAKQGAGNAPGYRNIAYLVFEQLPLIPFGNRIPNLSVEICRPVGDLESSIRAVCLIPGSTEFGYDPAPRVRVLGEGRAAAENTHMSAERSDWDLSIDELTALCPNLEHVGLVVAWFGTDLRCGHCVVEPRSEAAVREVKDTEWIVAGRTRATANTVSLVDGAPAYGGTPSDAAVKAAIADLSARGISVTLYPFVMMDVPADNTLTDPYTLGTGQPAYPWRGRITCSPAPGMPGSPDGSASAAAQVDAFLDNGYREMILHYAQLAEEAGGVEAFLIGSEMRHLTWVRSGPSSFPFVDALKALAADVRAIVGDGTKIAYAADWSEYSGLQPADAPGDKIFHLDPLWADANIDAVGIDNYMPIADWRDGRDHPDGSATAAIYDLDYLKANIAGGEGFDWYYANDADRTSGVRTPIVDGAHGEDWVYRYKDLVNWWREPHHNRIGGVRSASATAWVPQSKPIWLTEIGCGAVDKGPNAPNAFGDPKSSEDKRPPFSSGVPDPFVQRQALRAMHQYWSQSAGNPASSRYSGRMLDTSRMYLWCWDARPFPAFPGMSDVWSDAANYATGHWLNGRLGTASPDELIAAVSAEYGVAPAGIAPGGPHVEGMVLEDVMSLRDAIAPLTDAGGLVARDGIDGIAWVRPDTITAVELDAGDFQRGDGPLIARRRGEAAEQAGRLSMQFFDRMRDYQAASVNAVAPAGDRMAVTRTGLVLEAGSARAAAAGALERMRRASETLETQLPPSLSALDAGDVIALAGEAGRYVLEDVRTGTGLAVKAAALASDVGALAPTATEPRPVVMPAPAVPVEPVMRFVHLPKTGGGSELLAGAYAEPWPGRVTLGDAVMGETLAELTAPMRFGTLAAPMAAGTGLLWSRAETLTVTLALGHLSALGEAAVLAGSNRIAVECDDGHWEAIGFASAELVAPGTYVLSALLRGQRMTAPGGAAAGNRVVVLDGRLVAVDVADGDVGTTRSIRVYAGARDLVGASHAVTLDAGPALPLSPVHVRAERDAGSGDVVLSWVRRSRNGGDGWTYGDVPLDFSPEAYRVTIRDGAATMRVETVSAPVFLYSAAAQTADFGGPAAGFSVSIEQLSAVLGPGPAAQGVFL
ncbi:baseplate multidomain protein megatron [Pelagibacterium xiamenense]|uniref:baseplate multidomain protein megatron n=1 Tax=Pelagibacterium xiamenense TaxID=2901140 RepID=UPI001E33BFBF|nr:glycoside hydrolase/phage tail family protein [Pelagibacterium xiamenense]MCD7059501.1 glycoside hydrolase/phage tail family protein [Pelagibacterium xiamenense]